MIKTSCRRCMVLSMSNLYPFYCVFLCVGNFMYFTARSKYMIMGSRFVVGECIKKIRSAALK